MEAAGRLMAEEARAKGAAAILGPTVNIQYIISRSSVIQY